MISAIGSNLPTTAINPAESRGVGAAGGAAPAAKTDFNEFSEVLSRIAIDAVDTVKSAEATSIQGVNDKASTQAVVEAVMSAERTLQTAVAIRDKAVSAYMELSRMAI